VHQAVWESGASLIADMALVSKASCSWTYRGVLDRLFPHVSAVLSLILLAYAESMVL